MSLEQAILELAGGMKELAAAIKSMGDTRTVGFNPALVAPYGGSPDIEFKTDDIEFKTDDAELEEAVTKVEQKARGTTQKDAAENQARIEKERDLARAEAERNAKEAAQEKADAAPLVYTTDVKPTLLKLNKEKGRDALAGLLKKYDAPNGDKIKQDDLALILADAEALLAA